MIKITNSRAVVTDDFISAMRSLYMQRLKAIKESAENYYDKKRYMRTNAGVISIAIDLLKNKSSMDAAITKLRCLEYDKFDAMELNGKMGLLAVTKPVSITDSNKDAHRSVDNGPLGYVYELGRYFVWMPTDEILTGRSRNFHFAPEKNLKANDRHPHHVARDPVDGNYNPIKVFEWYEMRPNTCWGGFSTGIFSAIGNCDLIDLYRLIKTYLDRYDINSPLARMNPRTFSWAEEK